MTNDPDTLAAVEMRRRMAEAHDRAGSLAQELNRNVIIAGDVVRLKSGSPPMTVTSVTANASADVAWFERIESCAAALAGAGSVPLFGRACANTYPVAALERVTETVHAIDASLHRLLVVLDNWHDLGSGDSDLRVAYDEYKRTSKAAK